MMSVMRAACVLLLGVCLPLEVLANSLIPSDRWIERVSVKQPLVPYKLGLVSLTSGGGGLAAELPAAARSVLKQAAYFDAAATERVHIDISLRSLSGGVSEVEYLVRRGPAAAANAIIYRQVIRAVTQNQSMASESTDVRVLAGNVKLFTIDFRNRFDSSFATQSAPLVAAVNEEVDSRGILSHIGEAAANTLVATVEGTAAVVGTVGEVVASEEFHRGLNQVAGEYQRNQEQVAINNARMASMQAAAAREREAQAAADRAAVRQRQAEQQAARAAQVAMVQQQTDNRQAAAQASAAQRKAEADARAARQVAEREARIAKQEREARANAAYQMRSFVASSAAATPPASAQPGRDVADNRASRSANDSPAASKAPSRGQARAWCMLKKNGEFWCNGPLQNGGWGKTLKRALEMVDCPDGQGYTPTVGHGGSSFNCGRELRSTEREVPLYDPFYNREKKY